MITNTQPITEPAPIATGTITIGRRTYAWAKLPLPPSGTKALPPTDRDCYKLTGERGAVYWLTRNVPKPYMLFAINDNFRKGTPFDGKWFSDKSGTLEYLG